MTDAELTARVRGLLSSGPGPTSLRATQPTPALVVVEAHPTSNFVPVLTASSRRLIDAAVRAWLPAVEAVRFDPHH